MVLGIAMMSAMLPTMIGLNQAIKERRGEEEEHKEETRNVRSHLTVTCDVNEGSHVHRQEINNAKVYLGQDHKIYITKNPNSSLTPFDGHFYSHPAFQEGNTAGLISMSGEDKPLARWVFLDSETNEMKWGGRNESDGHVCGPFNLTVDGRYITLEDNQKWLAVRLPEVYLGSQRAKAWGLVDDHDSAAPEWTLYFDRSDGIIARLPAGTQTIEVLLKQTPVDL
ncbi:hypothetical protein PENNAL_c0008G09782 [Penicillium nalgiovense]|uniref:Uncharacterized protein n=1 Tax=Penicillium nalgiovense TaxID=60175 RepID=A0A1V6YX83_PENNA|nr:hypothetical protein PENNAL_c0008G09782 [Penicillium nalgiovense]